MQLYDTLRTWWSEASLVELAIAAVVLLLLVWIVVMILTGVNIFSVISMRKSPPHKIVVFDLDETLGCFVELGMFWDSVRHVLGDEYTGQSDFNHLMSIFPEFTRPNIVDILKYLVKKRRRKECQKIMIYTNNQGPRSWATMITEYFDSRVGEKVFDQIIAAFRVRGQDVELCRTSHDKSRDDLIRCTRIPKDTQICFLDDQHHPMMDVDNVYYINVKPYTQSLPYEVMASRYYDHMHIDMSKAEFVKKITAFMKGYSYTVTSKSRAEQDVDEVISKQIMLHLDGFFNIGLKKNTTVRRRRTGKRRTLKKGHK